MPKNPSPPGTQPDAQSDPKPTQWRSPEDRLLYLEALVREPGPPEGRVLVAFTESVLPYTNGEIAAFEPDRAKKLIAAGAARRSNLREVKQREADARRADEREVSRRLREAAEFNMEHGDEEEAERFLSQTLAGAPQDDAPTRAREPGGQRELFVAGFWAADTTSFGNVLQDFAREFHEPLGLGEWRFYCNDFGTRIDPLAHLWMFGHANYDRSKIKTGVPGAWDRSFEGWPFVEARAKDCPRGLFVEILLGPYYREVVAEYARALLEELLKLGFEPLQPKRTKKNRSNMAGETNPDRTDRAIMKLIERGFCQIVTIEAELPRSSQLSRKHIGMRLRSLEAAGYAKNLGSGRGSRWSLTDRGRSLFTSKK